MARDGKYATIKLASGEIRRILITCLATIGQFQTLNINYRFQEKQEEVDGKEEDLMCEQQ